MSEGKEVTITVKLKNGTTYEKKRVPDAPFGQNDRMVSFFIGDGMLRCIPMENVVDCTLFNVPE